MRRAKSWRPIPLLAAAVACILVLGACSAGSLGSSDKDGGTTLNFLVDNSEGSTKPAQGLAEAFHAKNPDITVQVQQRPGGAEGDNIVKTRLSTGEMTDVFLYNSGSLFQALNPQKNLVPLTGESWTNQVEDIFKPTVSRGSELYGAIYGQGMSVAAVEGLALRRHLERGTEPQPRRWFRDLARVVDVPWDMSAGGDLVFPGVPGRRTPKVRLDNAYIARLHAAAAHDASLASAFIRVAGLVAPPQTLLRPQVAVRVLWANHPAAETHGRLQHRDADDPGEEVPIPSASELGDSPEAAGSPTS